MGQALADLQAAIAAEDSLIDQAIAVLDSIPGLITAAQTSDNPDAALEALTADIATHTANLKAGLTASGQEPAPPTATVAPTTLTSDPAPASDAPPADAAPAEATATVAPTSLT